MRTLLLLPCLIATALSWRVFGNDAAQEVPKWESRGARRTLGDMRAKLRNKRNEPFRADGYRRPQAKTYSGTGDGRVARVLQRQKRQSATNAAGGGKARQVEVSMTQPIFVVGSSTENSFLRAYFAKILNADRASIQRAKVVSRTKLLLTFQPSVSRSQLIKYVRVLATSTCRLYSGQASSIKSVHAEGVASLHGVHHASEDTVAVRTDRAIFQNTRKEKGYLKQYFAKLFNIKKSEVMDVQVKSGNAAAVQFAISVTSKQIQKGVQRVKQTRFRSASGQTSAVSNAKASSSVLATQKSGRVVISVQKPIFEKGPEEVGHLKEQLAELFQCAVSAVKTIKVTSPKTITVDFSTGVTKKEIKAQMKKIEDLGITSHSGSATFIKSAIYSPTGPGSVSYKDVKVSVTKAIFQKSSQETAHLRSEIAKLLQIPRSQIKRVRVNSGRSLDLKFGKGVDKAASQRYISKLESSSLSSYTGQTSRVSSASHKGSSQHSAGGSYRNVQVSVQRAIFQKSAQESAHLRTEISGLLGIPQTAIKHVRINSGRRIAVKYGKTVSKTDVQKYNSQLQSSTLSSFTGQSSNVNSAGRGSSSPSNSGSANPYRKVDVAVQKNIFQKSGQESSYVKNELSRVLGIDKSLIKHVNVLAGNKLGIDFAKGVSKTDVNQYLNKIKSSTLSSRTGQSSNVRSASQKGSSSSNSGSTNSYRKVDVAVQKNIFQKSGQESSYVKNELSRVLGIDKSLIKHVNVLAGNKLGIDFAKGVSKTDVNQYLNKIKSSTLSSRTGQSSNVRSASQKGSQKSSNEVQHVVSSEVKVEVMSAVLHKSAAEEDNLRASFARLFNIKSNQILQAKVLNKREFVLKFDKSVKRQNIEERLTYAQNGFISSANGQQSMVMQTRLTGSTQPATTNKKVTLKTHQSVFKQSTAEMAYLKKEVAKKFKMNENDISRVEVMNGKKLEVYFKKNVDKKKILKEFKDVKGSKIKSLSGSQSDVRSTSYRKVRDTVGKKVTQVNREGQQQRHGGQGQQQIGEQGRQLYSGQKQGRQSYSGQKQGEYKNSKQTSRKSSSSASSRSRSIKVSVQRGIFQNSAHESAYLRKSISQLLGISKTLIRKIYITSSKTIKIKFSKRVSQTKVRRYITKIESSTLTSNSGGSTTVKSIKRYSTSRSSYSYRSVRVHMEKSVFQKSRQEEVHLRSQISKLLYIKPKLITKVHVASGRSLSVKFANSVSKSTVKNYISRLESFTLSSRSGRRSLVKSASNSKSGGTKSSPSLKSKRS
jgi:bifunctional DNA-binding transcriptional regulator/antitoxin component of YhaV-PrlF toxin-antitoxin module